MTQEQEIRVRALEIAAAAFGRHIYAVIFQNKKGQLKIDASFDRILKGVERYINGEQPEVFEFDREELADYIDNFVESKT
jgi:hypothetical protein